MADDGLLAQCAAMFEPRLSTAIPATIRPMPSTAGRSGVRRVLLQRIMIRAAIVATHHADARTARRRCAAARRSAPRQLRRRRRALRRACWSRCATPAAHNFVGVPIDGYEKPICYLTRQAAAALAQVVADLEPRGLTLKVFDCYRPERAVAHFVRWARNLARREDEGRSSIRTSTRARCSATATSRRAPVTRAARPWT